MANIKLKRLSPRETRLLLAKYHENQREKRLDPEAWPVEVQELLQVEGCSLKWLSCALVAKPHQGHDISALRHHETA